MRVVVDNWCHNYSAEGGKFPTKNFVLPAAAAKTSLSSSSNMYHVDEEVPVFLLQDQISMPTTTICKLFDISTFLAQCGDVESNPGPKAKKEAKPDPKKVMEDKVRLF